MGESIKCSECGTYLEADDCFDTDFDAFVSTAKYVGHCPHCNKQFIWKEIYIWQGFEELEEIK